jgi:choline-sulfatase
VELPRPSELAEVAARSPAAAASLARCGWDKVDPVQSRTALARYMGCVSFLDHLVGELLDTLEATGQAERTLVMYVSDHGDQAAEQGLWLKSVMFDGACRKPAILRMPGVLQANSRSRAPVNEVDLLPTLAGLVGQGGQLPLTEISGRSQADRLLADAGEDPGHLLLAEVLEDQRAYSHLGFGHDKPWTSLVATERFKLTRTSDDSGRVTCRELYDLDEDPGERTSLASDPDYEPLITELERGLEEHLEGMREPPFPLRRLSKDDTVASL